MNPAPFLILETGRPVPSLRRYGRFPHWIRVAAGLEEHETVVVDVESNSGSSVAWVRSDSIVAESADGSSSLVDTDGNVFDSGVVPPGIAASGPGDGVGQGVLGALLLG